MNEEKKIFLSKNNENLFEILKEWFKEDFPKALEWRRHAREDYAFYSGDQWSEEDKQFLREQNRPIMTFNRIAPLINAILGAERNNKRGIRYIPRELGDAKVNEILSSVSDWFREQSDASYEDSEAFSDAIISGMGWTDVRLDFEIDLNGFPVIQRLDPLKMVWDSKASKSNLIDAERLWYVDEKPISIARSMFPGVCDYMLHADWAKNGFSSENERSHLNDETRSYVTLVEARWFDYQVFYKILSPFDKQGEILDEASYKILKKENLNLEAVRFTKKITKRAFLGKNLLAEPDSPLVPDGQFGWECITAYPDYLKKQFYGIVRASKDPQRWNNKFFSQIMYLLNSQAKGGILAERGAFENDVQAEESLSRSDQITWLRNGALGRIQPKPAAQFPGGFFTLFQETKEAITQVTGISSEFIGTREANQPGILEYRRQQASLNLLAQIYDSLRRYHKRQGLIILYLIQNYLSDGRLIRIVGDEKAQYIALTSQEFANQNYDIIIDEAPNTTNEKEMNFAIMQNMMPYLKPYLTPELTLEILNYSPLPTSFVQKIRQIFEKQNTNHNNAL